MGPKRWDGLRIGISVLLLVLRGGSVHINTNREVSRKKLFSQFPSQRGFQIRIEEFKPGFGQSDRLHLLAFQ